MIVLGIVGSPAGGKSTVAKHLQDLGATWIDADQVAREVSEQDDVQREIIRHFGSEVTTKEGRVDRARLAERVFGDDDSKRLALTYLEGLIHPRTRQIIAARLCEAQKSGCSVVLLDVPLLFESGWDRCCDEIWCVEADRHLRLERAGGRGWDDVQLRDRESNQLAIEEKKRLSTRVMMNNESLEQLRETIDCGWSSLMGRHRIDSSDSHCSPTEFPPDHPTA